MTPATDAKNRAGVLGISWAIDVAQPSESLKPVARPIGRDATIALADVFSAALSKKAEREVERVSLKMPADEAYEVKKGRVVGFSGEPGSDCITIDYADGTAEKVCAARVTVKDLLEIGKDPDRAKEIITSHWVGGMGGYPGPTGEAGPP
jgi:hypothetical protein